jgi:hypothetical protein
MPVAFELLVDYYCEDESPCHRSLLKGLPITEAAAG